ncbi:MAG: glycine zipper family protein [Thermodesulfobacteriota bacterium]
MNQMQKIFVAAVLLMLFAGYAFAEDFMIFPGKGQSNEQLEKDKYDCYQWAKQQSGFDPMAAPQATTPPPQAEAPQTNAVKGAARGALLGVAVGAIAGDAGKGAAIGAASGGLVGGMRKRDQVAKQEQAQNNWEQQQAQQYAANRDKYNRAYTACLEGKGYTVK